MDQKREDLDPKKLTRLRRLLDEAGWHEYGLYGLDTVKVVDLANALDIAAHEDESLDKDKPADYRTRVAAARDEAARFAWPPPLDSKAEMAALRAYRRREPEAK